MVVIQTFGGLITAVVIKYSDNNLKRLCHKSRDHFVIPCIGGAVRFQIDALIFGREHPVLAATWMYNQPTGKETITHPIPTRPSTPFNGTPSGSPKVSAATALGEKSGVGYLEPGQFGDMKDRVGIWTRLMDLPGIHGCLRLRG